MNEPCFLCKCICNKTVAFLQAVSQTPDDLKVQQDSDEVIADETVVLVSLCFSCTESVSDCDLQDCQSDQEDSVKTLVSVFGHRFEPTANQSTAKVNSVGYLSNVLVQCTCASLHGSFVSALELF